MNKECQTCTKGRANEEKTLCEVCPRDHYLDDSVAAEVEDQFR